MDLARSPEGLSLNSLKSLIQQDEETDQAASLRAAMALKDWSEQGVLRHDPRDSVWRWKK